MNGTEKEKNSGSAGAGSRSESHRAQFVFCTSSLAATSTTERPAHSLCSHYPTGGSLVINFFLYFLGCLTVLANLGKSHYSEAGFN